MDIYHMGIPGGGYGFNAYAADASGKTLRSVDQVNTGEQIRVYVKDGSLLAQVQEKQNG